MTSEALQNPLEGAWTPNPIYRPCNTQPPLRSLDDSSCESLGAPQERRPRLQAFGEQQQVYNSFCRDLGFQYDIRH